MKKILIPTKTDDTHAILVKLALEKKGHHCVLWYLTDFPEKQVHSLGINNNTIFWHASGTDFVVNHIDEFDVVWLRRPQKPMLADTIHPDDVDNAKNENDEFCKTLWQMIAPNAFWVNAMDTKKSINCKLKQLTIAIEVGLNVPETLISNDPARIKDFIKGDNQRSIIYKTLHPMIWIKDEEMRLTYTKEIKLEHLPSDGMLQNTPGIFQKKINKAFELRITYLGDFAIAAKLRSQEHPKGIMDWRYVPTKELIIESFSLPHDLDAKCRAFMSHFGIVFGCFDFIVTPDNEYYFLEINEQGQFLWIEDVNPTIKLLDAFTDFLIAGSKNYRWTENDNSVSLADFNSKINPCLENAMQQHKSSGSLC